MRRTMLLAIAAWCAGFAAATVTAHAYTKLNAWRSFGEQFQLGYVVGYIDAVKLSKYKDTRAMIPTMGRARHQDWLDRVNQFYDDPRNAQRPIPDAMLVVGRQIQAEIMRAYKERHDEAPEADDGTPIPAPD